MLRHACGYALANKGTDMHRLSELSRYTLKVSQPISLGKKTGFLRNSLS